MNYNEALDYIHSVNWTFCKPGLERITALCKALGDPQEGMRFIHVAGTNGKGSFCAMTAAILRSAGYKVGLFTSPYIKTFNERMMIDGEMIGEQELADLTSFVRPIADAMEDKPTEFELITAIALLYFRRHACDVVVLEAGMGGRLDSTNVIRRPLLSVITGIALDHTAFLGDTVEKIAAEKAGVIKDARPVLYGGEDAAARRVIADTAKTCGSAFYEVDHTALTVTRADLNGAVFNFGEYQDVTLNLLGTYQPRNAAVVLQAVAILRDEGMTILESAVREGLSTVTWRGRFELLANDPPIIFDGAHNAQGIAAAVEGIRHYFGGQRVYVMTGVLQDKDYRTIARALATVAARAFVLTPDNPRALAGEEYARLLEDCGVPSVAYPSVKAAYTAAVSAARAHNIPLICLGSLYTYASL